MSSIDDIRAGRLKKLELIESKKITAFPVATHRDYTNTEVIESYSKLLSAGKLVTLAGRILSLRPQGAIVFFTFDDGTGKFQGFMKKGEGITDADFDLWSEIIDIGDFAELTGTLFETQRGEKTLNISTWKLLSKSLLPLPEKWHGLVDVDERFRKRYLDVISSPEVKARFIMRSKIVTEIRKVFDKEGYLEVETPILQSVAGGASAEPFKTHHNALDIDMYLRIAPELYLKELLVAGFPKVYEIGRLFRNEGIDVTHNPEFTTIEYYEAFSEAKKMRAFTEKVLKTVVKKATGSSVVKFDGHEIDFGKKFAVITFQKLLKQYASIDPFLVTLEEATAKAVELGVKVDRGDLVHKILDNIYKKVARPKLIQPTFIIDYPTEFSPLAKHKEGSKGKIIDRFQPVAGGYELGSAFSELNDPVEQRRRFEAQEKIKAQGDAEAQVNDEAYVEAMEHGMPPAAGAAFSIDRLTMLLTNTKNIREVILFPTLRPKQD